MPYVAQKYTGIMEEALATPLLTASLVLLASVEAGVEVTLRM